MDYKLYTIENEITLQVKHIVAGGQQEAMRLTRWFIGDCRVVRVEPMPENIQNTTSTNGGFECVKKVLEKSITS